MHALRRRTAVTYRWWAIVLMVALFGTPETALGNPEKDLPVPKDTQIASLYGAGIDQPAPPPRDPIEPAICEIKPGDIDSSESTRIATEQPGGVAERVYLHYDDADVAMRSYAAVNLVVPGGNPYCSGTMIGPNVMMSAGHCGQANVQQALQ